MNSVVVTLCVLFALAALPAPAVRGVVATAAGTLFEGTPFILAGLALRALPVLAFAGCGCGRGGARSLPAAAAAAMTFGLPVALARLTAATLVARLFGRPSSQNACASFPGELAQLFPAAAIGGIVAHLLFDIRIEGAPPALQWAAGAAIGCATPCALGAVALAASLHARTPFAAIGVLCTNGILNVRALSARAPRIMHDAVAYAIAALALAIVAARNGDALVHPRFAAPLACAAVACGVLAIVHRRAQSPNARIAPIVMLAGALFAAPAPAYTATETTLSDAFPGERVTFTGRLVHGADADAVVRFAITCCRADAAPVVLRLARRLRKPPGTWLRVDGAIERSGTELRLAERRVEEVAPPRDPFVYR